MRCDPHKPNGEVGKKHLTMLFVSFRHTTSTLVVAERISQRIIKKVKSFEKNTEVILQKRRTKCKSLKCVEWLSGFFQERITRWLAAIMRPQIFVSSFVGFALNFAPNPSLPFLKYRNKTPTKRREQDRELSTWTLNSTITHHNTLWLLVQDSICTSAQNSLISGKRHILLQCLHIIPIRCSHHQRPHTTRTCLNGWPR